LEVTGHEQILVKGEHSRASWKGKGEPDEEMPEEKTEETMDLA